MEDYMLDGNGIVSVYHCTNCGADIEYYISEDEEKEDADELTKNQISIFDFDEYKKGKNEETD